MALRSAHFGFRAFYCRRNTLLWCAQASHKWSSCVRYASSDVKQDDAPITYSTSKAAQWKAIYSLGGLPDEEQAPWYQMWSVLGSVTAFLLYFCVLRERNDLDEQLDRPLLESMPELEVHYLVDIIRQRKANGQDVTEQMQRLAEIKNKHKE